MKTLRWAKLCLACSVTVAAPDLVRGDILAGNVDIQHPGVYVYGDGDQGNVSPARQVHSLGGGRTLSIAVDSVRGELLEADADFDVVRVFDAYANGSPTELREIFGPHTDIFGPFGIAVDLVHHEIVTLNHTPSTGTTRIVVHSRTASGDVAPLRVIGGPATLFNNQSHSVAVDPQRNEIFVTQENPAQILVFSRTANGNVAPLRVISGVSTKLQRPYGVVVDVAHDEILVSDMIAGILAYPRAAGGNAAPTRRNSSASFVIAQSIDLLSSDEVVVDNLHTDATPDEILVFSRTATGNATPKRRIAGAATGLSNPQAIAVLHKPLILNSGRFEVEGTWRTSTDAGGGTPHGLTPDTGTFWYFEAQNLENVVKILNGCDVNQHFWVFAGGLTNVLGSLRVTDLETGAQRIYDNPQNTAFKPIQDTAAFATCQPGDFAVAEPDPLERTAPTVTCSGLCLNSGRFKVTATWQDAHNSGTATGVAVTSDTGYLWFFAPNSVEVLIKVLNGCGVNGHQWVFAGGLTNVHVTLTVHDSQTGLDQVYTNALNHPFQPIQDTGAFACP